MNKGKKISKLPNFLVVGASQSGTTSLYRHLKAHPSIFMPKHKESRFFSNIKLEGKTREAKRLEKTFTKSLEEYKKIFENVKNEKAIGDNSPDYLYYHQQSVKNIIDILGEKTKIIIILRNPIERGYTLYLKDLRRYHPFLSFEEALQRGGQYGDKGWYGNYPKEYSLYYRQVKAFVDNFENVKIYLKDELETKPEVVFRDLYEFLEVDPSFSSNFRKKYNAYPGPPGLVSRFYMWDRAKFKIIEKLLNLLKFFTPRRLRKGIKPNLKKPKMKEKTRNYLKEYYRDDIAKLEKLINKDLSKWLK